MRRIIIFYKCKMSHVISKQYEITSSISSWTKYRWLIKILAIWNWNHEKADTDSNYVKNATIVKYLYNIVFNIIDTNVGQLFTIRKRKIDKYLPAGGRLFLSYALYTLSVVSLSDRAEWEIANLFSSSASAALVSRWWGSITIKITVSSILCVNEETRNIRELIS